MPRQRNNRTGESGFGLLATVIVAGLLAALATGVAQVFAVSARASQSARVQTMSAVLAAQTMEQLRSLTFAHAPGGSPLADASCLSEKCVI